MIVCRNVSAVALSALLFAGCGSDEFDPRPPAVGGPSYLAVQESLDEKRSDWDAAAMNSYDYHYRRSCFCPEGGKTVVVTVAEGEVTEAFYLEGGVYLSDTELQWVYTIDGLFDEVQDAIDERVYELSVEYHETLGYPSRIAIDVDEMMVDEEITHFVSDLQ